MQQRATEARRANIRAAQHRAQLLAASLPPPAQELLDPFAARLALAQEETLDKLLSARQAKDRASLSQALRNLRETYQLVTGEGRNGKGSRGRERGPTGAAAWSKPAPAQRPATASPATQPPSAADHKP